MKATQTKKTNRDFAAAVILRSD